MYKIIGKQAKTIRNLGGKGMGLIALDKNNLTPNFLIISGSILEGMMKNDSALTKFMVPEREGEKHLAAIRKRISTFSFSSKFIHDTQCSLRELGINSPIIRSSFAFEDSRKSSYAGLFQSYRGRHAADVFFYIKKVWASRFTESVRLYQKRGIRFRHNMGVIIQDYIQPDFSGVVFIKPHKDCSLLIEYQPRRCDRREGRHLEPFVCILRRNHLYFTHKESQKHRRVWLGQLMEKIKPYTQSNRRSWDIEFVVSKGNIFLVQIRPLVESVPIKDVMLAFGQECNWEYHREAFSVHKTRKLLGDFGINFPRTIEKKDDSIFLPASLYFTFVDGIAKRVKQLSFLEKFYKKYSGFIIDECKKVGSTKWTIDAITTAVKNLSFRLGILDYVHTIIRIEILSFMKLRYGVNEDVYPEYFTPPLSFGTYKFFSQYKKHKKSTLWLSPFNQKFIKDITKGMNNAKKNQKIIYDDLKRLRGRKRKYSIICKKLVWLRDAVDYYQEMMMHWYGKLLSRILQQEGISYTGKHSLELCILSRREIQAIKKNKTFPDGFIAARKTKRSYGQKRPVFPLRGAVASKGDFCGTVRIVRDNYDIQKIGGGDIFVAENIRPHLVPGMIACRGIITEDGGMTSHAAIIARELGKPCIVNVSGCMGILRNGDRIKVLKGKVYKR